jgi:hypothetical protein
MPVWPTLSLQTAFNTKAGADVFRQNQLLQATRAPTTTRARCQVS